MAPKGLFFWFHIKYRHFCFLTAWKELLLVVLKPSDLLVFSRAGSTFLKFDLSSFNVNFTSSFQHTLFFSQRVRIQPLINSHLQKGSQRRKKSTWTLITNKVLPCDGFEIWRVTRARVRTHTRALQTWKEFEIDQAPCKGMELREEDAVKTVTSLLFTLLSWLFVPLDTLASGVVKFWQANSSWCFQWNVHKALVIFNDNQGHFSV